MIKFKKSIRRFEPVVRELKRDPTIDERYADNLIERYAQRREGYSNGTYWNRKIKRR